MIKVKSIIENYDSLERDFPGVYKKINGQAKAMINAGLFCEIASVEAHKDFVSKVLRRFPGGSDGIVWKEDIALTSDCLYIRRPAYLGKEFRNFLMNAKKKKPTLKIILELPTYPYDQEYKGNRLPMLWKDKKNRNELSGVIDRIADLSGRREIFGVPTIQIINGIDLDSVRPRRPSGYEDGINLVCAASFASWHGIDRLLEGLACYYSSSGEKRDIKVHLIGNGSELECLKRDASRLNITNHVLFCGICDKKEMDELYDRSTLAVECLGCHRKGLSVSSSLKSREYLAKGIPFVYSGEIDVFANEPVDFCLQVPANDAPVDIEGLVRFHDSLYENEPEEHLIARIRSYAEGHVSMDKAMENVIDYIKENCGNEYR